jgi:membrane protein implicated in regulation of membrane protease activity
MPHYIYWLIAALVLLGVEMVVGNFYMMALSLACALAGTLGLAALSFKIQVTAAVVAAVVGLVMVRRMKTSGPARGGKPAAGGPVRVVRWNEDGTARVHYQGEEWDAELESPDASTDAAHDEMLYVKSMHGSKLLLTRRKP